MEMLMPIILMLNLVGWLGVVELLWTCYEEYRSCGALSRDKRIFLYGAVAIAYILIQIRATPFAPL